MSKKYKTIVIGDTEYELTPHYLEGQKAYQNLICWHNNPYTPNTKAWDEWASGYENQED